MGGLKENLMKDQGFVTRLNAVNIREHGKSTS